MKLERLTEKASSMAFTWVITSLELSAPKLTPHMKDVPEGKLLESRYQSPPILPELHSGNSCFVEVISAGTAGNVSSAPSTPAVQIKWSCVAPPTLHVN
jgi:hypothetical protein